MVPADSSPARVFAWSPRSPLESSNKPRQARPVSVRVTLQALSESSAVIRRPCRSRPLSVPESRQECRSSSRPPRSFRPAVVHRCRQTRPPSSFPSSSNHSRPPCPPVSSAVPARVARQVPVESVPESSGYRQSRPDSCTVPARIAPSCFCERRPAGVSRVS